MSTVEGPIVLTQDVSSGTVHKRVQVGKRLATFEACNLDQAGEYRVLDSLEQAVGAKFCGRCFPDVEP